MRRSAKRTTECPSYQVKPIHFMRNHAVADAAPPLCRTSLLEILRVHTSPGDCSIQELYSNSPAFFACVPKGLTSQIPKP